MDRIAMADQLEERARRLRAEAARPLPDVWKVGQKVRYLRDSSWAWSAGGVAYVQRLLPEYEGIPASQYQVFYTGPKIGHPTFWTTPDDVELAEDEQGTQ